MAGDFLPRQEPAFVDPIVNCIVFDATGRIKQSGACARSLLEVHAAHFGEGFRVLEVPEGQFQRDIDATSYVRDGAIVPKQSVFDIVEYTIQADGLDEVRFAVPAGTSVIHDGDIVAIEDGVFEFITDALGDYRFSFIAPAPFLDFEVTIHAV